MKSIRTLLHLWTVAVLLSALPARAQRANKAEATPATAFTAQATAFLHRYVNKEGRVNYAAVQRSPGRLEALLYAIANFEVARVPAADQYAFYLNAYNVLVIGDIVRHYPLKSVQEIPGFFNKARHQVGCESLTLDQLETDKLRRSEDDPRLHFALVCGTQSCPRLNRTAYSGARLSAQLDNQVRFVLANPAYVKVSPGAGQVQLPEVFKWHEADFGADGKTSLGFVNQFRKDKTVPTWFAVAYYPHNWALNDLLAK